MAKEEEPEVVVETTNELPPANDPQMAPRIAEALETISDLEALLTDPLPSRDEIENESGT